MLLDLDGIKTRDEFFGRLTEMYSVPRYFGRNLDALHDLLSERGEGLKIYNEEQLKKESPVFFERLSSLIDDMEDERNERP